MIADVVYSCSDERGDVDIPPIPFLQFVETVCFSFFPVGRAFIVLRELDSFRWSRMRDVAAEIKLRSQAFPVI